MAPAVVFTIGLGIAAVMGKLRPFLKFPLHLLDLIIKTVIKTLTHAAYAAVSIVLAASDAYEVLKGSYLRNYSILTEAEQAMLAAQQARVTAMTEVKYGPVGPSTGLEKTAL